MSTSIEWTDETWTPVTGCQQITPGCGHCYAKTEHDRRHAAYLAGNRMAPQYAVPFENVQLQPKRLTQPLSWRQPRRIFVCSGADLFHDDVPLEYLARVWAVMALAPRHTFQVLTKRPARMRAVLRHPDFYGLVLDAAHEFRSARKDLYSVPVSNPAHAAFYPQIWVGVSVENQRFANERIPILLDTPAAVRFLSCEPLLGPLDFTSGGGEGADPWTFSMLRGEDGVEPPIPGIDWVIVGGESGKGARRFELNWGESILDQCRTAGVPAFMKQIGAHATLGGPDFPYSIGGHGDDMERWPNQFRVREFPASEATA